MQVYSEFKEKIQSCRGAGSIEYALCCALLFVGVIGACRDLSGKIVNPLSQGSFAIYSAGQDCPSCSFSVDPGLRNEGGGSDTADYITRGEPVDSIQVQPQNTPAPSVVNQIETAVRR